MTYLPETTSDAVPPTPPRRGRIAILLRCLAVGSTLGWGAMALWSLAAGIANVGTMAAAIMPTTLWVVALATAHVRKLSQSPVENDDRAKDPGI